MSPGVIEGSDAVLSVPTGDPPLPGSRGATHPLEGRVQGQHLHCLGGWLPGAADREAPGCWVSAESPSQAPPGPQAGVTCKHGHPQVWPGGASWEGKNGQQLGSGDRARSWAEHTSHPTMQCPHPQDRAQKRVVLWQHIHFPLMQGSVGCIHCRLQEARRPLAAPRHPLSQTGAELRLQENWVGAPTPCRF